MLSLKNVSAGYDGTDVIKNISFEVKGNVVIVGPNGCGKTTLLKAIANILPFKGKIEIEGKPFDKMKRREISKNIAMLTQQVGIYFDYNVYDTVMMGRYLHIKERLAGNPIKQDIDAVMESLEAVNLLDVKDREITKLSGGQLQRVFLARALAQDPKLILLDEPTNHLDLKCQIEIADYLKKWAASGDRAIIGVLHDLNLAMQLSEDMIVMNEGKVLVFDKASGIIKSGLLDDVYEMDVAEYMRNNLSRWF